MWRERENAVLTWSPLATQFGIMKLKSIDIEIYR